MSVYICRKCKRVFSEAEADIRKTTYEDEYGCGEFGYPSHPLEVVQCPDCGEEESLDLYMNLVKDDFKGDYLTDDDMWLFD